MVLAGYSNRLVLFGSLARGDVVWIPPESSTGTEPTPTTAMTHIAVQESLNGVAVNWLGQVTNEQYQLNR
jgi:hypothetical protein